jgi:DNA repair exonuclease SbcCD ATPase subunit
MSVQKSPPQPPSFGDRLTQAFTVFVRALLRLLLLIIIATAIGALAYYGLPMLYRNYIQPVKENTAAIADLQTGQTQLEQQLADRIEDLLIRINTLETRADRQNETLNELLNRLQLSEEAIQEHEATLEHLDELQAQIDDLADSLDQLQETIAQNQTDIHALEQSLLAQDTPLAALRREVRLVQVMERLTRSRVLLAHQNLGLATAEVEAARQALIDLKDYVAPYQLDALQAIIERLDLALDNLPDSPLLAGEDLEAAWQMLTAGLPAEPPLQPSPTTEPTP